MTKIENSKRFRKLGFRILSLFRDSNFDIRVSAYQRGLGIIEIIVAMAIMIIIAATGVATVLHSFSANRLGDEETFATLFAQEGVEAVRSIKNQSWSSLSTGTFGLESSLGYWSFLGTPDTSGKFTRQITISPVQRDPGGNIVESGGTVDPDTYKLTSSVNWDFSPERSNEVKLVTYLSNWEKPIGAACTWTGAAQAAGIYDLGGGQNGTKVAISGNYAYIVRDDSGGGQPDLAVIDISDPDNPQEVTTANLLGNVYDIFISGDLAFLATARDGRELWVVDITNPASPNAEYAYADLPRRARGVHVDGNYAYLVTNGGRGSDFFIFDISNLPTISGPWGVDLDTSGRAVYASGNRALVATNHNSRELMVVDTSNKTAPLASNGWAYDTPGCNSDATGIFGLGDTAFLTTRDCGDNPEVYALDVSDYKNGISKIGAGYEVGSRVDDIFIDSSNQAYLATHKEGAEYLVVDVSSPASGISEIVSVDMAGEAYGVAVSGCTAAIASGANDAELQLIKEP